MLRLFGIYVWNCPSVNFSRAKLIGCENKMISISASCHDVLLFPSHFPHCNATVVGVDIWRVIVTVCMEIVHVCFSYFTLTMAFSVFFQLILVVVFWALVILHLYNRPSVCVCCIEWMYVQMTHFKHHLCHHPSIFRCVPFSLCLVFSPQYISTARYIGWENWLWLK